MTNPPDDANRELDFLDDDAGDEKLVEDTRYALLERRLQSLEHRFENWRTQTFIGLFLVGILLLWRFLGFSGD
jgi:hypothetical protein